MLRRSTSCQERSPASIFAWPWLGQRGYSLGLFARGTVRMRREFLHPKYWITWMGLGLMRSLEWLPYSAQRRVGSAIGVLFKLLPLHSERIARRNVELCRPSRGEQERASPVYQPSPSLAIGLSETTGTWW